MQRQDLKFASYGDLEAAVLPKLRGRIFHVTTPEAYARIQTGGFVHANADERYPMTCAQSQISYFRRNGCVCLVDLRDISDEDLAWGMKKYYFPNPFQGNRAVFLILCPRAYERVIRPAGVGLQAMIVPEFEAGYRDSLPLSLIGEVISIEVAEQPDPLLSGFHQRD